MWRIPSYGAGGTVVLSESSRHIPDRSLPSSGVVPYRELMTCASDSELRTERVAPSCRQFLPASPHFSGLCASLDHGHKYLAFLANGCINDGALGTHSEHYDEIGPVLKNHVVVTVASI